MTRESRIRRVSVCGQMLSACVLAILMMVGGCSSGSAPVAVSLSTGATQAMDQGQTMSVSATVLHDGQNAGVTWTIASGPGALSNPLATSVTYSANGATGTAVIMATSVKDKTKTATVTVTVTAMPKITTTTLPAGAEGTAYTAAIADTGGAGNCTYSISAGTLPAGLTLSPSGTISGTPTGPKGTANFTVKATDASTVGPQSTTQALSITINLPAAPHITTTTLPAGTEGAAYSQQLAATGLAPMTFATSAGSLPAGLTMSSAGLISGSPTGPTGTASFTVKVTDGSNPVQSATQPLGITINLPAPPAITTTTLPAGTEGLAYSQTVAASGGLGTLTFSISTGSLPTGLTMSSGGVISGTPTGPNGTANFTVQVRDQSSPVQTGTKALSILINLPGAPTIAPATLPNGAVGTAYSQTLTVTNGLAPYTWSVSVGTLPAGLTLAGNGTTAKISGTPTTAQSSVAFTIQVADSSNPSQQGTQAYSVTIAAAPPFVVTTTSSQLPAGMVSTVYPATTLTATGGTTPYSWMLVSPGTGPLPTGLALSSAGVISGTPSAAGVFPFTVQVTDSKAANATANLSITIAPTALVIATTTLPNATVNVSYSEPLEVSGGAPPYNWAVTSGSSLPNWLSIGGSGTSWTISGTPTQTGTSDFSLTVTDSTTPTHQSKAQVLSVTVVNASTACGSGNESIMKGQYAFSLRGWSSTSFLAAIGSFTADGKGHITAGTVDSNGALGVQSGSITTNGSSYSVGSDNRGCATIVTPFYTFTTRFSLVTPKSGAANEGAIEEWEPGPTPYIAVGKLLLQQNIPAKLPAGSWVFQQTGIFSTSQNRTGVVGVDKADGQGNFTDGEYDSSELGFFRHHTGVTGTYTSADATTGRFLQATSLSGVTVHRVDYLVSSTRYLELVADALGAMTTVLIGEAEPQSGSLTVSGNLVYYSSGLVDSLGSGNTVHIGLLTITGASSFTGNLYEDYAGTWTKPTPTPLTCSYSIDAYGELETTTIGSGCFSYNVVIYLTGPNSGVMMGLDRGVLNGRVEAQSATTLTNGAYFFGTVLEPVNLDEITQVGTGTINGSSVTGTSDITSPGSPQQANQPLNMTITVNPDGTFSNSNHPGVVSGIIVSNSIAVVVDKPNSVYPTIIVLSSGPTS